MSDPRTDLPPVKAANFNQRIRETLMTYLGRQGDPLDRGLTLRDLIDAGLIRLRGGQTLRPGQGSLPIEPTPGATDEAPDLTPPPTPTGFAVTGGVFSIFIEHDPPRYLQGHGHLRTRVYGKSRQDGDQAPTFDDAAEIAQFSGTAFAYATNPATTWHLWIKWETQDGALSTSPAGGTNGLVVTTGEDVSTLLDALAQQITESELSQHLNERINLVDGGPSLEGSVDARIEAAIAPDLTPPPNPQLLSATGGIFNVLIEVGDALTYSQGHGHSVTALYGAQGTDPSFERATLLAEFAGKTYSWATSPATTWFFWIKFVTKDGVRSVQPSQRVSATTGQDVSKLLEALSGEITESQLYADLGARIDLIDGPAELDGSVNFRLAEEAAARAAALALEAQTRTDAIAGEALARNAAIAAETEARNAQIAVESHQRLVQVQDAAYSSVRALLAAENERVNRLEDVASARQELSTDLQLGLQAEATARLALTTVVNQNVADILSEQTARSTADSALAGDISTLFTQVGSNTAAIQNEAQARSSADAAEAAQRTLLATQFRGNYTGTDINQVTEGLLYQERLARATQDNALAQQITLLSAGTGEQFDWKKIWYFDDGVEGWTGNGTPTVSQGWLRPANQASNAYVESPTGIGSDGNKYGQLRLRIRKTGAPTFAGYLWWRTASDTTWDASRRIALSEPTFDANGIGLITASVGWTTTIDRIRVDLSSAQTATDAFEIDWVAIGRPSPGASSAQLLEEQEARANADLAEAAARKTLSSILVGKEDPTGLTLPTLTSGLLFEERKTRSDQDGALATSISSLQAAVEDNFTTLDAAITDEQTARVNADSAEATARQTLSSTLLGVADPTGLTLETLAAGLLYDERQTRVSQDGALAASISGLSASLGETQADILDLQETVVDLEEATARVSRTLVAGDRKTSADLKQQAETALRDVLALDAESRQRKATLAVINEDLTVKINEGLYSEAKARWTLAARVDQNAAAIQTESEVRASQLESVASQITTLTAQVDRNAASIQTEATTRATADAATAQQITTLTASIDGVNAALQTESATRASAIEAEAFYRQQLQAQLQAADADLSAAIENEATARSTAIEAEATARQTLQATVDDKDAAQTAALTAEATVRAAQTGELGAKYAIKIDLAGHVSGYGLASTANNSTPISEFGVRADKFFIAPPSTVSATAPTTNLYKGRTWVDTSVTPNVTRYYTGEAWSTTPQALPFVVLASPTTVDGKVVPAGVYINGAYIQGGTIDGAAIKGGTIENTKLINVSADKITGAALLATSYIESATYKAGESGWKIHGDGTAELSEAIVRGTISASDGDIGGVLIDANRVRSSNMTSFTEGSGFWLGSDGRVQIGNTASGSRLVFDDNGLDILLRSGTDTALSLSGYVNGAKGQYSVKIDSNGYVTGYGLYSDGSNSQFIVNADQFAVTAPAASVVNWKANTAYATGASVGVTGNTSKLLVCKTGGTSGASAPDISRPIGSKLTDGTVVWQVASRVAFAVNATTSDKTINGVTVPRGTFIDGAYIQGGTINGASIVGGSIENSKLINVSADKITGAALAEVSWIESFNYVSGTSGWRIDGNGAAELANAVVRGTVYASAGEIGGNVLGATFIRSDTYTKDTEGWKINSGGTAEFNSIKARGVTIYNDAGGVILASGTGIPKSAVSGLGAFAGLDSITTSNVSTYIADAAIGSAQVGTLTAGNIDSRGLDIRDAQNNIILSSGNTPTFAASVFSPILKGDFFNDGVAYTFSGGFWNLQHGFTAGNIYPTAGTDWVTLAATNGDPILRTPTTLNIDGSRYHKIQVRLRRTAGTSWDGIVFFETHHTVFMSKPASVSLASGSTVTLGGSSFTLAAALNAGDRHLAVTASPMAIPVGSTVSFTGSGTGVTIASRIAAHSESGSYYKYRADGTIGGEWVTLEWDMASLTVGSSNWTSSAIKTIRFDFGGADAIFDVDWIALGRYTSAGPEKITAQNASTFIADLAVNTLQIAGNAVTVPLTATDSATYTPYTGTGDTQFIFNSVYGYTFNMPNAGKVIVQWQAEASTLRRYVITIYLNSVEIGRGWAGDAYNDSPLVIGFGEANAGSNNITILLAANPGWASVTRQKLIILGAQR